MVGTPLTIVGQIEGVTIKRDAASERLLRWRQRAQLRQGKALEGREVRVKIKSQPRRAVGGLGPRRVCRSSLCFACSVHCAVEGEVSCLPQASQQGVVDLGYRTPALAVQGSSLYCRAASGSVWETDLEGSRERTQFRVWPVVI